MQDQHDPPEAKMMRNSEGERIQSSLTGSEYTGNPLTVSRSRGDLLWNGTGGCWKRIIHLLARETSTKADNVALSIVFCAYLVCAPLTARHPAWFDETNLRLLKNALFQALRHYIKLQCFSRSFETLPYLDLPQYVCRIYIYCIIIWLL